MYLILESTVLYFQAYHVVRTPSPCWNQAFHQCNFVLWLVQVVLEPAERQIYVPGDVRQEKEIIVIYQPYVVE